ncbi:MAG: hypothetical protein NTX91_02880 [candidate division SR1 bacterium]|nr:hypothetical protein [candidate division SR1 bacterium]
MVDKIETKNIEPPKTGVEAVKNLDQILESKITDKATLDKAKPIFAAAQKNFSQPINDYVNGLDEWSITKLINTESDPVKFLIGDIDAFMGTPVVDLKKNQITTTQNEVKTNVVVKENKENIKTDAINTKSDNEKILEAWNKTADSYAKLDKGKYPEPSAAEIAAQVSKINPNTKAQLEANGKSAEEYTKFLIMQQKYEGELRKNNDVGFLTDFKELREKLGDTTTLDAMRSPTQATKVVEENPDLKNFATTSPRLDSITAPPLPEIKDVKKEFETYVKFIPDPNIKAHVIQNQKIILSYKNVVDKKSVPDKESIAAYKEYTEAIAKIKAALPQAIQASVKYSTSAAPISGLSKYFDTTTINEDNFAKDFDIKTDTSGFSMQKGQKQYNEQGDDVLCINGHIKGNQVSFYYNLNNPDAQLKSEDYLHYNKENNEFALGVKGGGKRELGVKLPTISMLSDQAQRVSEEQFPKLLENSTSREDLTNSLQQKVSDTLLKNYTQEALIKSRVERDVEKNITTQTLHHAFVPDNVLARLNENNTIDSVSERNAWSLMQIRDKSTEHMKSFELRNFRNLLTRLDPIRAQQEHSRLEPSWQSLLTGMKKEGSAIDSSLAFFQKFSKNGEIQLHDLEVFVTSLEKKESIGSNMNKFSPEFQTNEDQASAGDILNSAAWGA